MQLDFSVLPFPSIVTAVITVHLALLTTMNMLNDLVYPVFQLYIFVYPKKSILKHNLQGYIKQTQKPQWVSSLFSSLSLCIMFENLYGLFLYCLVLERQQFFGEKMPFYVCVYIVHLECLYYSVDALNNAEKRGFGGRGRSYPVHQKFMPSFWDLSSC